MKSVRRKSVGTHYSLCVQPAFIIGTNNEDGTHNFAHIFNVDLTKLDPVIYSGLYHSIGNVLGKIGDFSE